MIDHHAWTAKISEDELQSWRRQAEMLMSMHRESITRSEACRERAREHGLTAVEEFFFQAQQSDQRIVDQAERLFGSILENAVDGIPPRDKLVDHEAAESFPASDPPTYSRIT